MDPLTAAATTTTAAAAATTARTHGGTRQHGRNDSRDSDQASLISALTGEEVDADVNTDPFADQSMEISTVVEDEPSAVTHTGAATLVSNTSSNASDYFLPHHRPNDSLCYSTTSSTNSPPSGFAAPSSTYLGAFGTSLRSEQAFPSSMFPGQKLVSPSTQKEMAASGDDPSAAVSSRAYPSYYCYAMSQNSIGINNNMVNNHRMFLPPSYQNGSSSSDEPHSNVYQKRRSEFGRSGTNHRHGPEHPSLSSWNGAVRCIFSPRVLATLVICGVIAFNLLQEHRNHHHGNNNTSSNRLRNGGVISGSSSIDEDANYIKLETIGGGNGTFKAPGDSLGEEEEEQEEEDSPKNEEIENAAEDGEIADRR
mmetsp:Transcript_21256/g.47973  ORF Transcript_21256/g.47973 Transcript_21256/m.47973 type:complete len:366 (+) Transcript_21256:323-1420(+)|eukprot:CAMPEP_0201137722 /NCGR_PEP_ID=MMETSP0850-20130426/55558_1 /ASSEMBLY_ACC=CAM_ASM_000622 /TAXON_ID=183588 /ORGANISM="Pseudo-nitzschia fraudulenta, Strain WWA7" /LENGTH=365 /DNA_ID=CAMNT_0047409089 /DNA_START=313 /DNA_END=1410 /DNA_ORIENTATION=-